LLSQPHGAFLLRIASALTIAHFTELQPFHASFFNSVKRTAFTSILLKAT